ncbi:MAG: M48 family metallopeptidase [Candidatus Omnitrophica bacterium]|nr:M48 family metallopeptidase [Candidatus Omnitrophota bacterium]
MRRKSSSDELLYDYFLWDQEEDSQENRPPSPRGDASLLAISINVCQTYKALQEVSCSASFYPYSDIKSTIKIEKGEARIRISDMLRDAPDEVFEALVHILIARALHRKPKITWLEIFNNYIHKPDVEKNHAKIRRERCRKVLTPPQGKYYNLRRSFQRVNQTYFNNALPEPQLSWSPTRSRRQLGYHDSALNLIVISRFLDRESVPEFMVDYIMYHELLHTIIRPGRRNGRRIVHSQEFKRREREYEFYDEAMEWLNTLK